VRSVCLPRGEEEALSARDPRAFELLYDQHSAAVYSTALGVVHDRVQAQDIVQEVFMRLWRQPGRFDAGRGTLGNYLRLMARSQALDTVREARVARRARERLAAMVRSDEGRTDERPPAAAELRLDQEVVLRALVLLPEAQRQAIVLAYWGGLTSDRIADVLGVPVGTVKSRLRLGLRHLRGRCEPQLAGRSPIAA
jgi:RNA polymerase sigma-70 factor, ECF subfamily